MQSNIFKMRVIICISLVTLLSSSCTKKTSVENQITIKINSIDSKTKRNRINAFDTIDVRIAEFGFPMRKYVKEAEYVTDSTGSVKVKLDQNKEYHFILGGKNIYGAVEFSEGELKDAQEVNIEVVSTENR